MKNFRKRVVSFVRDVLPLLPKMMYNTLMGRKWSMRITSSDGEVMWHFGDKDLFNSVEDIFSKM